MLLPEPWSHQPEAVIISADALHKPINSAQKPCAHWSYSSKSNMDRAILKGNLKETDDKNFIFCSRQVNFLLKINIGNKMKLYIYISLYL